jgi:hypothetical protein
VAVRYVERNPIRGEGGAGRRFPLAQRARALPNARRRRTIRVSSLGSLALAVDALAGLTTLWPVSGPSQALHRGGHGCGGANPDAHVDGPPPNRSVSWTRSLTTRD